MHGESESLRQMSCHVVTAVVPQCCTAPMCRAALVAHIILSLVLQVAWSKWAPRGKPCTVLGDK